MENYKIKICHVATVDVAVKFLLISQLKFLLKEGYDVCVVCSPGKWIKDIEREGIKVKTIKITRRISPLSDLVVLLKLFLYFRREKFQIVHTHNPKPGLLGQLAAKLAGVPIIVNTIHGLYFHDYSSNFKRKFFIFIDKIAARCSDLIFSQNREDINTLIEEGVVKPEKIKYLGNGIDLGRFNPERFSANFVSEKKKELGLAPDTKVVGTIGRLVEEKGYLFLFESFEKLLGKLPNTRLLVVGPEEPEKKDKFSPEIVKKYGIEKNVVFLGERTDVDEIYPVMDVFVLPSLREGMPRTIIEAMAMSKPIVATQIRGCSEEIDNNINGILVPPKDSKELEKAIILLLKDKNTAKKMADSARIKAIKEFDERIVFDRISKEYQNMLRAQQR